MDDAISRPTHSVLHLVDTSLYFFWAWVTSSSTSYILEVEKEINPLSTAYIVYIQWATRNQDNERNTSKLNFWVSNSKYTPPFLCTTQKTVQCKILWIISLEQLVSCSERWKLIYGRSYFTEMQARFLYPSLRCWRWQYLLKYNMHIHFHKWTR